MSETREFHLGAILSVTTGRLVAEMDNLYAIVNHLTGDNISTIGLLAAAEPCKAALLAQHPQLAAIDVSSASPETRRAWLSEQTANYGPSLPVEPMAQWEKRSVVDDILDIIRLNPKASIIVVEP
jgi:hypothetical protein